MSKRIRKNQVTEEVVDKPTKKAHKGVKKTADLIRKPQVIKIGKKHDKPIFKCMKGQGKRRYLFGYRVQQTATSMWVLERVLASHRPDLIIELGTGFGVLTTYFSVYGMFSDSDVEIISIDLAPSVLREKIELINDGKTQLLQKDIYAPETVKMIQDKINKAERPFILVDGKDPKSTEVNLYANGLKEGVVMFAHDAILEGNSRISWGFKEDKIDWNLVDRLEPFYTWAVEGDTRMLCMVTKNNLKKV